MYAKPAVPERYRAVQNASAASRHVLDQSSRESRRVRREGFTDASQRKRHASCAVADASQSSVSRRVTGPRGELDGAL